MLRNLCTQWHRCWWVVLENQTLTLYILKLTKSFEKDFPELMFESLIVHSVVSVISLYLWCVRSGNNHILLLLLMLSCTVCIFLTLDCFRMCQIFVFVILAVISFVQHNLAGLKIIKCPNYRPVRFYKVKWTFIFCMSVTMSVFQCPVYVLYVCVSCMSRHRATVRQCLAHPWMSAVSNVLWSCDCSLCLQQCCIV